MFCIIHSMNHFLERWFHLGERQSSLRAEVIGGVTTFVTMAYIVVLNPAILAAAGIPVGRARWRRSWRAWRVTFGAAALSLMSTHRRGAFDGYSTRREPGFLMIFKKMSVITCSYSAGFPDPC